MATSAVTRVVQYLPDGGDGSMSDFVANTTIQYTMFDDTGADSGEYNLTHLEAIQNPSPASPRASTLYSTPDEDLWSDSPVNQPDLDDRFRYAFGRFDNRYRSLNDYVGVVISDRNFSKDGDGTVYDATFDGNGYVRDGFVNIGGSMQMQDQARVYGEVTLNQIDFIVSASPVPFSYKNPVDSDVSIRLSNYAQVLNSGTVTIRLDGGYKSPVAVTPFLTGIGGLDAEWVNDQVFDYDAQVDVRWSVFDEDSPPNEIVFVYWFRTVGDFTGPRVSNEVPADDSTDVSIETCIEFDVRDYETGVNISTLELYVNNRRVYSDSLSITSVDTQDGYHVRYCPTEPFLFGDVIAVSLYVEDVASEPNYVFHTYSFTTEKSLPPRVIRSDPRACREYIPTDKVVSIDIVDGGHGLDKDSIDVSVDDETVIPRTQPIIYRED